MNRDDVERRIERVAEAFTQAVVWETHPQRTAFHEAGHATR